MKSIVPLALALVALAGSNTVKAQSFPPVWSVSTSYAVGDQVQVGGNTYRCIAAAAGKSPLSAYSYWEANFIRNSINVSVGSGMPFPNLVSAWSYIQNAHIGQSAAVKILISTKFQSFNESFSSTFSLNHPFGSQVSIVGDNPQHIDLTFPSSDALEIDSGHVFGTLSNVTITGNGSYNGITGYSGSQIENVTGVYMTNFYQCVVATNNASITLAGSVNLSNYVGDAVVAQYGGQISVGYGFNLVGPGTNTKAVGILAYKDGKVELYGASIYSNNEAIAASARGAVDADGCTLSGNATGIDCKYKSYVSFENGQFDNTTDVNCTVGGFVDILGSINLGGTNNVDSVAGSYILGP